MVKPMKWWAEPLEDGVRITASFHNGSRGSSMIWTVPQRDIDMGHAEFFLKDFARQFAAHLKVRAGE